MLSFATRMEDWTSLGQHKRHPEFPVVIRESCCTSRKTTWFPRHRKMEPCAATASQEKSHFRNWSSKRYLSPLMRPTKCPDIPVSLETNTEVFRQHFLGAPSTLLIWTGGSTPLLCLEGVPDRPVARRHSRRGLVGGSTFRRTPISRSPLGKNPMPGHLFELHPVNEVNTKGQLLARARRCAGGRLGSRPTRQSGTTA